VPGLSGSCLLTGGKVLEHLGGLDDQLDTASAVADLCLRVREAACVCCCPGRRSPHDGPNTTAGTTPSGAAVLSARWGEERVAPCCRWRLWRSNRLRQPARCVCRVGRGGPHGVSLCLIVRNRRPTCPTAWAASRDCSTTSWSVDTGLHGCHRRGGLAASEARRLRLPRGSTDFAAARNESLHHARGRWVLWLAPTIAGRGQPPKATRLLAGLGDERGTLCRGGPHPCWTPGGPPFACSIRCDCSATAGRSAGLPYPRADPAGGASGWAWCAGPMWSFGSRRLSGRRFAQKQTGAQPASAELDGAERPDDSFSLFNLGWTLLDLGRTRKRCRGCSAAETDRPDASIRAS